MKVIYIGMYGGGSLYFNVSVEEAKRRYIESNPEQKDWDFMIGSPSGEKYSAIDELETDCELIVYADGLASLDAAPNAKKAPPSRKGQRG